MSPDSIKPMTVRSISDLCGAAQRAAVLATLRLASLPSIGPAGIRPPARFTKAQIRFLDWETAATGRDSPSGTSTRATVVTEMS